MLDNKTARHEVKLLKVTQGITYKEFADMLNISRNSMYCWLNSQFDLGEKTLETVSDIITELKGE